MTGSNWAVFFASTLRLSTPLLLAATGEVVSERAGVLNLSLEGMMLTSAFMGALGAHRSGSPMIGLAVGVGSALVLALAQAFLSVKVRANQLVVGIGFNILALGATTFLYRETFGGLSRDVIPSFSTWHVPALSGLPFVGVAFFQQVWLVYAGIGLLAITGYWLERTALGLSVRAVGENPRAADQAGISVSRVRTFGVLYAGFCAGLAGAFLSLGSIDTFTEGMTAGAGYLAVTAVILGDWKATRVLLSCLLFGSAAALQFLLPAVGVHVPTAVLLALPYVLALLAVSGVVGKSRPPSALTLPYRRGSH